MDASVWNVESVTVPRLGRTHSLSCPDATLCVGYGYRIGNDEHRFFVAGRRPSAG
jgi:hypothetical protein